MVRKLSVELVELVESGVSIQVGTRDASLLPEAVRGVGARAERGGAEITVFVPAATGELTLANCRDNARIAVCFTRIEDHFTIQCKGRVVAAGEARERDRAVVERYRGALAETLAFVGMAPRLTYRVAHWPCYALRFRIESIFVQTPGPGAGDALAERSAT